jgi:hypothetical protein
MGTTVPSILTKLPFDDASGYLRDLEGKPVEFGRDRVIVKGLQVIVWVGITRYPDEPLDDNASRIPAILDTGHLHYFTLQHFHLAKSAGMPIERLVRSVIVRSTTSKSRAGKPRSGCNQTCQGVEPSIKVEGLCRLCLKKGSRFIRKPP